MEEAEKARDQAKQDKYNVGVAETEEALRAEVSEICRNFYLQVWNKAFNQAGVDASFALRRAESVYYPPAICAFGPANSNTNTTSEVVNIGKASPAKIFPSPDSPSKVAKQLGVVEKEANTTKGVAIDATKPLAAP